VLTKPADGILPFFSIHCSARQRDVRAMSAGAGLLGAMQRIAVIGAGPSGLVAAKHALDAGFDVSVFEASDALGGQWHTTAAHSGVWPGMHTNTSRALTAFSDFPAPAEHPLHPAAEQVRAYLHAYAHAFGVDRRIRFGARVADVRPGWTIDGEPFDGVIVASGRFRKPRRPRVVDGFRGEVLHAFDYPGAEPFRDRPTLVYGNGISGLEIACDLAPHTAVVSAFRTPRYVIEKVVDGVSSDWQWYTLAGALERRALPADEWIRRQRERIVRVAGNPADFGAPDPSDEPFGVSLAQGYLQHVRAGAIACRPRITAVEGTTVHFADGTSKAVAAIVCATGYDVDIPYLSERVWDVLGSDLALYHRTFHPDLPGLAMIGQFLAQGPYFPLLELQARWIAAVWSGAAALPDERVMRHAIAQPRPPLDAHNMLALTLSEQFGVAPGPDDWPDLREPLLFGPLLPPRYRLSGPGARADAAALFVDQLAASPCAPVELGDYQKMSELRRSMIGRSFVAS
jgi:cation diffusion facilitator CzcD-associated flavoprotein CzcO